MFIINYLKSFVEVFCAMAPWLLLGYLISGVIACFISPETIKKNLGGKGFPPILKAVLLGIPLPICSCGVIPIASALKKEGASNSATASFFIATPQTGVDNIMLTAGILGWPIAIIRTCAAFISGIIGGILIDIFANTTPQKSEEKKSSCCCCSKSNNANNSTKKLTFISAIINIFSYGYINMLKSTCMSLLTGIAIAAFIQFILPSDFGISALKGNAFLEMLCVVILAIPLYVCSNAAVPIALTLMAKGFSPGAALVFLIAGPAIHSVSLTSMKSLIGYKATIISALSIAATAIIAGILLNISKINIPVNEIIASFCSAPKLTNQIAGVILTLLLIRAIIARFVQK